MIMSFEHMMNEFKKKGMELFQNTKTEAAEALSGVAVKAMDSVTEAIANESVKAVEDVHAVATLAAINMTEAAANVTAKSFDSIGDKFTDVLMDFMEKLDIFKNETANSPLSPSKKLGVEIATALHHRLEGIHKAFVEQKNLTVQEFQTECKRSVEEARPKLEKHLDSAFVKMLLNPLVEFLDSIGLSFVSNFFKAKPYDMEVPENTGTISHKGAHI